VYFDPFWFEVSAYARISAGIELDLGFFSISLSISLGATIKVWGPDFAGRVEFEIGPCTIPVSFGSERKVAPELLRWDKFRAKYLEDGGTAARALSSITGKGSLPTSTGGATGAPSADGSAALPFQVFAEFEITFTTTIPTSTFDVGTASPVAVPVTISGGQPALLGLSPMGAHNLASTLMIRLDLLNPTTHVYERVDPRLARLAQGFGGVSGSRYSSDFFPLGVWGTPRDPNLLVKPLPSGDVVSAGKQVVLVAGVDMPGVGPDIDYHQVRADRRPLPLLATGNDRKSFLKVAGKLPTVDASTATEALTFAAGQMFADRMVAGTHDSARGAQRPGTGSVRPGPQRATDVRDAHRRTGPDQRRVRRARGTDANQSVRGTDPATTLRRGLPHRWGWGRSASGRHDRRRWPAQATARTLRRLGPGPTRPPPPRLPEHGVGSCRGERRHSHRLWCRAADRCPRLHALVCRWAHRVVRAAEPRVGADRRGRAGAEAVVSRAVVGSTVLTTFVS